MRINARCFVTLRAATLVALTLTSASVGAADTDVLAFQWRQTTASRSQTFDPTGDVLLAQEGNSKERRSPESLFDDEDGSPKSKPSPTSPWTGFIRAELAYTYAEPAHWSKMLIRSELRTQGILAPNVKYKLGARLDYDAVYDATDFYPPDVRRDQRFNLTPRETYIDIDAGDWDFRLGAQHIVWGEVVGLFFADVVSAKDLREFILPDFDVLRIPQWAARAEYFKDDFHAELVWIPAPSYDEIGKPGAEFFPAVPPPPLGFATLFDNEQFPKRRLANSNYGVRLSTLRSGWDLSGFFYRSMDAQPVFYRTIVASPQAAFVYQARHDRISQWGGTAAKDLGDIVFKAEAVYTHGRGFNVLRPDDDGIVRQNTLDLIAGLDFTLPADTRLNVQAFNRTFFNHDPDIVPSRNETGFSLLLSRKLTERIEGEVLYIASVNRSDWMLRPRLLWSPQTNWQFILGADLFQGPPLGFFGQFANRDRVYTEVRYSF